MIRVVVVDDSRAVVRQMQQILDDCADFQCVGQGLNGLEAIRLVQVEKPDILCMDMNMPVMDGLTALRAIKSFAPQLPVVMVSSLAGVEEKKEEARRLGAVAVLNKPLEQEGLIALLRALAPREQQEEV